MSFIFSRSQKTLRFARQESLCYSVKFPGKKEVEEDLRLKYRGLCA